MNPMSLQIYWNTEKEKEKEGKGERERKREREINSCNNRMYNFLLVIPRNVQYNLHYFLFLQLLCYSNKRHFTIYWWIQWNNRVFRKIERSSFLFFQLFRFTQYAIKNVINMISLAFQLIFAKLRSILDAALEKVDSLESGASTLDGLLSWSDLGL